MSRRVPLWLGRVAIAAYGMVPFLASAQETPPPIIFVEDGTPATVAAPNEAASAKGTADKPNEGPRQPTEQALPDHWIGLHLDSVSEVVKAQLDLPHGMAVIEVVEQGPAHKAGIQKNDILTTANGVAIGGQDDVFRALSQSKGEAITFELVRKGKPLTIKVTPEKRPESARPATPGPRIVIEVPPGPPPIVAPVVPGPFAQPKPPLPMLPPTDLSPDSGWIAEQWIKELEESIWRERGAAADQLQEARKAYEEAIKSIDVNEIESMIHSAIDEMTKGLKEHVREGVKALQSDEAKAMHRELLDGMQSLERALREQREVQKQERLELREEPANTLKSLKQEIKSLREEIERIKRESK